MSWTITTAGTADEIGKAFDAERDRSLSNGMIAAEGRDIDEARDVAMQFAQTYGRVSVSAAGHWSIFGGNDDRDRFQRVSITINAAPEA
jgi:hypothetical protein